MVSLDHLRGKFSKAQFLMYLKEKVVANDIKITSIW